MDSDLIKKPDAVEAVKAIPTISDPSVQRELSTIPVAPKTTAEEDKRAQAHRAINTTWENTQARIALAVVLSTCLMVIMKAIAGLFLPQLDSAINSTIPSEWWTILGLVIGFYFGRTNHARQGDVTATGTK